MLQNWEITFWFHGRFSQDKGQPLLSERKTRDGQWLSNIMQLVEGRHEIEIHISSGLLGRNNSNKLWKTVPFLWSTAHFSSAFPFSNQCVSPPIQYSVTFGYLKSFCVDLHGLALHYLFTVGILFKQMLLQYFKEIRMMSRIKGNHILWPTHKCLQHLPFLYS